LCSTKKADYKVDPNWLIKSQKKQFEYLKSLEKIEVERPVIRASLQPSQNLYLREKTQFFSFYMSLNIFLQIKRWSMIKNIKRPCRQILKRRTLDWCHFWPLSTLVRHFLKRDSVKNFFVSSFLLKQLLLARPDTILIVRNNRGVIRIRNWLLGNEYTGESIRISCVRQFFQT
jgi:hypothetical protein